jgi:hypothetical protein
MASPQICKDIYKPKDKAQAPPALCPATKAKIKNIVVLQTTTASLPIGDQRKAALTKEKGREVSPAPPYLPSSRCY